MESIILFVLIAVGSTIFQAIKQEGNKQKQASHAPMPNKPVMQPTVAAHKNPGSENLSTINKKKKPQSPIPKAVYAEGSQASAEGIQTEALGAVNVKEQRLEADTSSGISMLQDISFDELQRSIIMAEVLGKPKALRGNTR